MVSDEAVDRFIKLRVETLGRRSEEGRRESYFDGSHRALVTIGLYLLGGDLTKYREYESAIRGIEEDSGKQVSTDTLTLILIDKFPQLMDRK